MRQESGRQLQSQLARLRRTLDDCLQRQRQWQEFESHDRPLSQRQLCQPYGDLTELNTCRVILDAVNPEVLREVVQGYLSVLETSSALYEENGDYAMGFFTSGWCRFLDNASRQRCGTTDNRKALACGRWHCHESCWSEASRVAIETGQEVDVECRGGIRLYAVPIRAGDKIVGSINFGYGDPPGDPNKLRTIARRYSVSLRDLQCAAGTYRSRPPVLIAIAKRQLKVAARLIGEIVLRKFGEKALNRRRRELELALQEKTASVERYRERLKALTARLITTAEDERQRIARDLHDDLGQRLAALALETSAVAQRIPPGSQLHRNVRHLQREVERLSDGISMTAHALHPAILDVRGLVPALQSYCDEFTKREGIKTTFTYRNMPAALPGDVALNLYRIAQEALRNVSRHANTAHAAVLLAGTEKGIRMSVEDPGSGFDLSAGGNKEGLGLISMEERARMIGGKLSLTSRPGHGTRVDVCLPLGKTTAETTSS